MCALADETTVFGSYRFIWISGENQQLLSGHSDKKAEPPGLPRQLGSVILCSGLLYLALIGQLNNLYQSMTGGVFFDIAFCCSDRDSFAFNSIFLVFLIPS